jgi:ABC-type phosphate/phosphonate transport system substrate-binding protein
MGSVLASLIGLVLVGAPAPAGDPVHVRIGFPATLFRDIPRNTIESLMPTYTQLIQNQTGLRGQPVLLNGAVEVTQQLADNKIQLGVFHGFEFAWAKQKHEDLKPLVMAVYQQPKLTAQVIVAKDNPARNLEDLKGQAMAVPRGTREHCRLFLNRTCRRIGHRQEKFFGSLTSPPTVAAALDDVAAGRSTAVVVDGSAWESYKWVNPGRAARLRPLVQSEAFPSGVIAYKNGILPASELKRYEDGLTSAHQRPDGMQLMLLWRMSRFEPVPADYDQMLANIAKAYPPPIGEEP